MDWEEIKFASADKPMSWEAIEEITFSSKLAKKWEAYERKHGNKLADYTDV